MSFETKLDSFIEGYTAEHKNTGVLRITHKDEII